MNFKKLLLLVSVLLAHDLFSQELLGLQFNEAVRHASRTHTEMETRQALDEMVPLNLPFFDDFSSSVIYPDATLWEDRDVFVNSDVAYRSVNKGTATFDALDASGKVYVDADWVPTVADKLTSRYIRLDSIFTPFPKKLLPEDSLYLSFYYQPQGVGNYPEAWDTLVLEFSYYDYESLVLTGYDSTLVLSDELMQTDQDTIFPMDTIFSPPSCDEGLYIICTDTIPKGIEIMVPCQEIWEAPRKWRQVWKAEGMTLADFKQLYGKNFLQVMLPITDTLYYHSDFQFRFKNYATIANEFNTAYKSNVDQWNVDYVFLDRNRSMGDSTYRVVSFSERAPSFLKQYQVMPYRQYLAGATVSSKDSLEMYITNLDKVERNTYYKYIIKQVGGDYTFTYNAGDCNLKPHYLMDNDGFQNCEDCRQHACPPAKLFALDFDKDTAAFEITHYISDSSDTEIIVDSIMFHQGFYNYFAYDDGTPEAGIGMSESGNRLACQFKLNMPDTLRGVQIYFNRTLNDVNSEFFNLIIWRDNNGLPGEIAYVLESMKPRWEEGLYHFYSYIFDEPLILSGTFYVGMEQFSGVNLNIGFDRNNDITDRLFFNDNLGWYTSDIVGAPLIRPIIGPEGIFGVDESKENRPQHIDVYPNPASDYFMVDQTGLIGHKQAQLSVYNIFGSLVHQQNHLDGKIAVNFLSPGLYMIHIRVDQKLYLAKLLIN